MMHEDLRTNDPSRAAFDPSVWDAGCASDPVRNDVVLPHLLASIQAARASRVIDLGSGTGYLTRKLAEQARTAQIYWVLLDSNPGLLDLAAKSTRPNSHTSALQFDLTESHSAFPSPSADFAFAAFTFLEFPLTSVVAHNCAGLLCSKGKLLVYLPDTLVDVTQAGKDALSDYVSGDCMIAKLDHFTGAKDPFFATRIEHLLNVFLTASFRLTALDILPRTDRAENIYCCCFEKVP